MFGVDLADAFSVDNTTQQKSNKFTKKYLFGIFDMILANCLIIYNYTTMIRYPMDNFKSASLPQKQAMNRQNKKKCSKSDFMEMVTNELIPVVCGRILENWRLNQKNRPTMDTMVDEKMKQEKIDNNEEWNWKFPPLNFRKFRILRDESGLPPHFSNAKWKTAFGWLEISNEDEI